MEKKKKIIKIVLIVSIVLFLIILIIANKVAEKKEIEDEKENYYANKVYNSIEDFKTVEEVLIFKGVEYIKDETSFFLMLSVKEKYSLYKYSKLFCVLSLIFKYAENKLLGIVLVNLL